MSERDKPETIYAIMTGTYWDGKLDGFAGKRLKVVKPIAPPKSPNFIPDRFMLEVPDELWGALANPGRGNVLVFSVKDVESWITDESS